MEETRFEDFVSLISLISKEIQRIKMVEAAKLGLKGADIMCLYYLSQHEEGLTSAELAREADVTRAAVSRTLSRLEANGFVQVGCGDDDATRYRAPVRLTDKGRASVEQVAEVIRRVVAEVGVNVDDTQRTQMYRTLSSILEELRQVSRG